VHDKNLFISGIRNEKVLSMRKIDQLPFYCSFKHLIYKLDIGITSDLGNRILSHNESGTNGYAQKFRPGAYFHRSLFNQNSNAHPRKTIKKW